VCELVPLFDVSQPTAAPESAINASLGCGVPTDVADLAEGETVLDLASTDTRWRRSSALASLAPQAEVRRGVARNATGAISVP
jgi:hypothetical protein